MTREESLGSSLALDPLPYSVVRMSGTLKNENKMDDSAAFKKNSCIIRKLVNFINLGTPSPVSYGMLESTLLFNKTTFPVISLLVQN